MKLLSLALFWISLNAQASLYCALGDKTPSQHISTIPYATLQIDYMGPQEIQAYVTDYYNETDTTSLLKLAGKPGPLINGLQAGTYIDKNNQSRSELKHEEQKIIFVLEKTIFSCEVL